jgi:hypothetical protein
MNFRSMALAHHIYNMDTDFPFSAAFGIIADTRAGGLQYYTGAKGIYEHIYCC